MEGRNRACAVKARNPGLGPCRNATRIRHLRVSRRADSSMRATKPAPTLHSLGFEVTKAAYTAASKPSLHRRRNCATRQHAHQMRAIFRAAVDVAAHALLSDGHAVERFGTESLLERLLECRHPEHAIATGARHRDAHFRTALGNEHADQRITRGR